MPEKVVLTYFNIMGLGEPIRWMMSYVGWDFEDKRIPYSEWRQIREGTPFKKLPVLEVDGKQLHQSEAICRYLAKLDGVNLAGNTTEEDLEIDMVMGSFHDFRLDVWKYFYTRDEHAKAVHRKYLMDERAPDFLKRFDAFIEEKGGHLANGRLSWVDIYIVSVLEYFSYMLDKMDIVGTYPNIRKLSETVRSIPSIKTWLEKRPTTNW